MYTGAALLPGQSPCSFRLVCPFASRQQQKDLRLTETGCSSLHPRTARLKGALETLLWQGSKAVYTRLYIQVCISRCHAFKKNDLSVTISNAFYT